MKRLSHLLLATATLVSLTPSHALAPPKEFQLLAKSHVAMLCALQMVNLAIEAQRDPTGPADEAVDHSGRFFGLALTWLPDAAGVTAAEQDHLARFVVGSPYRELIEHGTYCGEEARARLRNVSPAQQAENLARGMQQSAVLARVIASGG